MVSHAIIDCHQSLPGRLGEGYSDSDHPVTVNHDCGTKTWQPQQETQQPVHIYRFIAHTYAETMWKPVHNYRFITHMYAETVWKASTAGCKTAVKEGQHRWKLMMRGRGG